MKWYKHDPNAFNDGVACLTLEHVGAYCLLLNALYARDGNLPDDDWLLGRIWRCDIRVVRRIKSRLVETGKVWVVAGKIRAKRVELTLEDSRKFSEHRAEVARKRGKKHNKNNKASMPTTTTTTTTSTSRRKKEYCRIADAIPTTHSLEKAAEGREKPRLAYDSEFDVFWKAYPTTRNMSKAEAWGVWRRLSHEDRQLAIDAVPKYADWLKGKGEKAPEIIHACRFLSKRRFDGYAEAPASNSLIQFYAAFGSQEMEAWDAYGRVVNGQDYPKDKRGGWGFPSRWPPELDQAHMPRIVGDGK